MGRYSILPASLETVETWVVRAFILFAIITLGPWLLVFLCDILYYLFRYILWELPIIGGKARGRRPPEPVQLIEHATGLKKSPSHAELLPAAQSHGSSTTATDSSATTDAKPRSKPES